MRTATLTVLVAVTAWVGVALAGTAADSSAPAAVAPQPPPPVAGPAPERGGARKPAAKPRRKVPSAAALKSAWAYAQARGGSVAIAVVDSEGKLRGREERRRYSAASTVKAMLLAAELRRLKQAGAPLDSETDSLLTQMITASDNDAADAIHARVGDEGMFAVAERMRMPRFTVAGHWGNAQVAAIDLARLFADLDRALVRKHRRYGKGLLGSVIESQSWGIPAAAGERWAVRFKGGWLPDHALAHQGAELRERAGGRELSIAILTDDQPSHTYATETVRGIAERLLSRPRDASSGSG